MTETLAYGTHLGVLSESFLMNTNMTGFRWVSKILRPCALDESSLSIGRVKTYAGGGLFCKYKMMQNLEKRLKP